MSASPFTDPRDGRRALLSLIDDGEHLIELRYRDGRGKWAKRWALTPASADAIAASLTPRGLDVYVGLAPRLGSKDEAQRQYGPVRVLWADCDTARSVAKLREFDREPTLVVASGGVDEGVDKEHAYWLLDDALDPEAARGPLRRLAAALDADPAAAEPARVLRLPGSRNHKTGRTAVAVRWTAEVHQIDALVAELPEVQPAASQHGAAVAAVKVPDGKRHAAVVSLLGLMRSWGACVEVLDAAAIAFVEHQCVPDPTPADIEHARATARDIARRY